MTLRWNALLIRLLVVVLLPAGGLLWSGCEPIDEEEDEPTPTVAFTLPPQPTVTPGPSPTPGPTGSPTPVPGFHLTLDHAPERPTHGEPVTLTATLLRDGLPVPDGTLISFTSTFGSLSRLQAGTEAGQATTQLTAISPGTANACASFFSQRACREVFFR
jgi:hypothetical protein